MKYLALFLLISLWLFPSFAWSNEDENEDEDEDEDTVQTSEAQSSDDEDEDVVETSKAQSSDDEEDEATLETSKDLKKEHTLSMTGYVSGKYLSRTTQVLGDEVKDTDLQGQMRFDVTSPANSYEFHFFGTVSGDLDQDSNQTRFSPFEDSNNTGAEDWKQYLYEAHFAWNQFLPHFKQLRLGRQSGTRDEIVYFDGLAFDLEFFQKLALAVYGGLPVHFFDLEQSDNTLSGLGVDYTPQKSTRLSLDYLSTQEVQEVRVNEKIEDSTLQDSLTSLKILQFFSPNAKGMLRYRWINGENRDFRFRSTNKITAVDLELNLGYFRQFRVQNVLTQELSPFYQVLGQSYPFQTVEFQLRKPFGEHYAWELGYNERNLLEDYEESAFNHDYKHLYSVFEIYNRLMQDLTLSVTAERWESEQTVDSAGWDIKYQKRGAMKTKIQIGSYYSLYKYDEYFDRGEQADVRTYYLKGNYPLGDHFSVNGSYEMENSHDDYNALKMGAKYEF
ncbi:hypothetical protein WDW89_22830 [Deltaproteobacteria bacterium TL4]